MPIEFQCTNCQNVLKVGDEHAGKSARCPSCKTVVSIPMGNSPATDGTDNFGLGEQPTSDNAANPFSDPAVGSEAFASTASNPYQAPQSTKLDNRPGSGGIDGPVVPTAVTFDDIIGTSWKLFTDNLLILVGAAAVLLIVSWVINTVGSLIQIGIIQGGGDELVATFVSFGFSLLTHLTTMFFTIGMVKICLKIARRQSVQFTELFTGGDKFLQVIVMGVIVGCLTMVGLALLIIPGLIIALLLWTYYYLIVDSKTGMFESMSVAYEIGKMNMLTTFVMGVASLGIFIVGFLMLCIGIIPASALVTMISTVGYLKMSGQLR